MRRWLFGIWVLAVVCGLAVLWQYEAKAGSRGPEILTRTSTESTTPIVLAVHPHCPCTRATLAEVERALARAGTTGDEVTLLFYLPGTEDESWVAGFLWEEAARLGFKRVRDPEAIQARALGLETSGHVLFYDSSSRLRFSGGVTASRGHEGENRGRRVLTELLLNRRSQLDLVSTPVFGCPIWASESRDER